MKADILKSITILRTLLLLTTAVVIVAALFFHSEIDSPSIYSTDRRSAGSVMDLSVDGVDLGSQNWARKRIHIPPLSTARLSGTLDPSLEGSHFMFLSDAAIVRVYGDGVLILEDGKASGSLAELRGDRPRLVMGAFPDGKVPQQLVIEFESTAQPGSQFINIDSLLIGSNSGIRSSLRSSIIFFGILLVLNLTIVTVTVPIMFRQRGKDLHFIARIFWLGCITAVMTLSTMDIRVLLPGGEAFWSTLNQLAHLTLPMAILEILVKNDGLEILDRRWARLMAHLTLALLASSALALPFSTTASFILLHCLVPASILALLSYSIAIILAVFRDRSDGDLQYQLAFCLLLCLSFILELVPTASLTGYKALSIADNLLRLLALVSYSFHAFSRYLTRERIILGREGLDELLYKDALTGCLNRRHFDSFSADDEALGEGFFIVVYDLDGIKHVNDSFGHSEGDRVFSHFGQAVGQTFGERSFTCRTGGDEFVSIVYGLDEEAFTGALESFAATFPTECPYSATFSSGWSRYDGGGRDDFEEALRKADEMMYSQKEEHRRQMARTLGRLE